MFLVYQINIGGQIVMCIFEIQAVIKQFSVSGYESSNAMVIDELELQRHQQLEKLYRSTRAGKVKMQSLFYLCSFAYEYEFIHSSCKK